MVLLVTWVYTWGIDDIDTLTWIELLNFESLLENGYLPKHILDVQIGRRR